MQQPPQQAPHWRDRLIARSEVISDALEVAKAYAARFAEWVLILCLIANLVEMFPFFPDWFGDVVLVIQAITLDIAGFGLATMGNHARRRGDERAAKAAGCMGWTLITLMIITATLVTLSVLIPETKQTVDAIEKALILARIVVTVLYGHVVHSLRQAGMAYVNELSTLRQEVSTLRVQADSGHKSGHCKVDRGQQRVIHLDTKKCGQEAADQAMGEQIRNLLHTEPGLSDRAMAVRLSCSPTTVGRWRRIIEQECVNE